MASCRRGPLAEVPEQQIDHAIQMLTLGPSGWGRGMYVSYSKWEGLEAL